MGLEVTCLTEAKDVLSRDVLQLPFLLHWVPHGSILGPLLLLVYVNDLPNVADNSMVFFADDMKCCKVIGDCQELQEHLDSLQEWIKAWHLLLNKSKCEVLTFSCERPPVSSKLHVW